MATDTTDTTTTNDNRNIEKAQSLLEKAEVEADTQRAQMFQQLAQAWLQIEQIEQQRRNSAV